MLPFISFASAPWHWRQNCAVWLLFDVPLAAYMQHYSPREHRGSILAASNFLTFGGILIASLAFGVMRLPVGAGSLENLDAQLANQPEARPLANQLWTEMQDQRARGDFIDVDALMEEHPNHAALEQPPYEAFPNDVHDFRWLAR